MAFLSGGRRIAAVLCTVALLLAGAARAQPASPVERAVKAAYLYKFAAYVDWPRNSFRNPDSPFVIGVAGNDVLAHQLEASVRGRTVGGRDVAVRRVDRGDPLDGVHILFVTGNPAFVSGVLARASGRSVLTVTDTSVGAAGGIIHFVEADGRLRFEVALPLAQAAQLHISARMLAAARHVVTGAGS